MSNTSVETQRSSSDRVPAPLPYTRAIRWLGVGGGILALLCLLSGIVMLIMKWAGVTPPAVMSQIPLVLLPVAFIALMIALGLAVLRRSQA